MCTDTNNKCFYVRSACQVTPFLSEKSSKLISYQRSVPWVLPRGDFNYSDFAKWIFRWIPFAALLYRIFLYVLVSDFEKICTYVNMHINHFCTWLRVKDSTLLLDTQTLGSLKEWSLVQSRRGIKSWKPWVDLTWFHYCSPLIALGVSELCFPLIILMLLQSLMCIWFSRQSKSSKTEPLLLKMAE